MLVERTPCQTPPRATAPPRAVTRRFAPERKIQIVGTPHSTVSDELEHARMAWAEYQSTRKRDAVYHYLWAVSKIVRRWRKEQRRKASSHQALKACGRPIAIRNHEPFATVIFCTSDPRKVDAKTRSKWSRVLRYAEQLKPNAEDLAQCIKGQGGINECAARFAQGSMD